jgi:DNA polymerase delta subunit 1
MMAYNVCYCTLLYDRKYLDLPGVAYINIQINAYETVCVAVAEGVLPKLLRKLVDARKVVKNQMAVATGYLRNVLNGRQLALKLLSNATYGYTGDTTGGNDLAVREIMYIVTSLGRYTQKISTQHVGLYYHVPIVYGDTDSIFGLLSIHGGAV